MSRWDQVMPYMVAIGLIAVGFGFFWLLGQPLTVIPGPGVEEEAYPWEPYR